MINLHRYSRINFINYNHATTRLRPIAILAFIKNDLRYFNWYPREVNGTYTVLIVITTSTGEQKYLNKLTSIKDAFFYKVMIPKVDFDAEGDNVMQKLQSPGVPRNLMYSHDLDVLFIKNGGGTVYVGNRNAAQNIGLLKSKSISRIVNCTHGPAKIPNYHQDTGIITYFEFKVKQRESLNQPMHHTHNV